MIANSPAIESIRFNAKSAARRHFMIGTGKSTTNYGRGMRLRKWFLAGVGGAVAATLAVLFVLHKDADVEADVLIARPPSDVWKVISDSAAYSSWNPFITSVDGSFKEGSTIRIVLGAGSDATIFNPTVLVVRKDEGICWRGSVGIRGLFDGKHCMHLENANGGTHFVQTEHFSGLLVGKMTENVIAETEHNFQAMNAAVKQRVEARYP